VLLPQEGDWAVATAAAQGLQAIIVRAQVSACLRTQSSTACTSAAACRLFQLHGDRPYMGRHYLAEQAIMQRAQGILASAAPGASEAGRAQALLRWIVDSAAVPALCTLMREACSVYDKSGASLCGRMCRSARLDRCAPVLC